MTFKGFANQLSQMVFRNPLSRRSSSSVLTMPFSYSLASTRWPSHSWMTMLPLDKGMSCITSAVRLCKQERHEQHSGSTICSKDFMSVSEAGWLLFIQLLQGKCGLERAELQNKIYISLLTCYVALDWFLNCNETFLKSEVGDNNTNIRWL